jgi:hypothetical protein
MMNESGCLPSGGALSRDKCLACNCACIVIKQPLRPRLTLTLHVALLLEAPKPVVDSGPLNFELLCHMSHILELGVQSDEMKTLLLTQVGTRH